MSVFSSISKEKHLIAGEHFFVIFDSYPVSPGHALIISHSEKDDYFQLSQAEKAELTIMIDRTKAFLEEQYKPDGYNIGMNCGEAAGQTVQHFHCHVIPRYNRDMEDPRGGVRGVIPGSQGY